MNEIVELQLVRALSCGGNTKSASDMLYATCEFCRGFGHDRKRII